jgi:hypothetical protein
MKKKLSWYKDTDKILEMMINAELKLHGKKMKDVLGKKNWFQKYTFKTEQEYLNWKEYCINLMTKEVSPRQSKSRAEKEFMYLDLMYGLKCKFIKS